MSINNGFYESVINKRIDEEIHKLNQKEYYTDTKQIDEAEAIQFYRNTSLFQLHISKIIPCQ